MPAVRASSPSSARDMWTLRPSTVTVTSLDRAISGPGREAMVPASRPGHRCRPKIDLAEGDVRDPGHGGQGQGGVDGKRADVQGGPSFPMKT